MAHALLRAVSPLLATPDGRYRRGVKLSLDTATQDCLRKGQECRLRPARRLTFVALILLPQVAPALKDYQSLDPHNIANVIDLPLPKLKGEEIETPEIHIRKLEAKAPANLVDPTHTLDHFYEALLKGGTVRILHYGDSPTTGDLITADARAALQKEFGDGGTGFVLIARPWAWYNHRGVEMEANSGWKIDIAGIATLKDGMHGLGGVSFIGGPGATAHWKVRSQGTIEIAYLSQPDGGAFAVDADDTELGTVETAGDAKTPGYASVQDPAGRAEIHAARH